MPTRTEPAELWSSVAGLDVLDRGARRLRRQNLLVLLSIAAIAVLDQVTKAWGWNHVAGARVNPSGDSIAGAHLNGWLRSPVGGAVFDGANALVLIATAVRFTHALRTRAVGVFGSLTLAGWFSNQLDRLGLHLLTAPGSARGAIDFVPLVGRWTNVADVALVVGCMGLGPAWATGRLVSVTSGRGPAAAVRRGPFPARWVAPVILFCTSGVSVLTAYGAFNTVGAVLPAR